MTPHPSHDSLPRLLFYLALLAVLGILLFAGACSIIIGARVHGHGKPVVQDVRWYS